MEHKLDRVDWVQIISISAVLITGYLPWIKSVKRLSCYSVIVVGIFILGVIGTVYTTKEKSLSDKKNYTGLIDRGDATIKVANQNSNSSQKIMGLTNESIFRLEDI